MGLEGEIANGITHKITTKIIKGGAMEQVAKLLKDFDLGAALVRLWIMAGDSQRLNDWEQRLNASTFDADMTAFRIQIESGTALKVADMESQPLALIRALDATFAIKQDLPGTGEPPSLHRRPPA